MKTESNRLEYYHFTANFIRLVFPYADGFDDAT